MKTSSSQYGRSDYIVAALLFPLFYVQMLFQALQWPFDLDETNGIYITMINNSWKQTILEVPAQASPSPLYYIIERIWLSLWSYSPQLHWDLRVFFRMLPALYWVSACALVYFFSISLTRRLRPELHRGWHTLLGAFASLYLFVDSFPKYYAMNARPYSLWVSLSIVLFIFLFESVRRDLSRREWILYGTISLSACLTAGIAISQVYLGFGVLALHRLTQGGWARLKSGLAPILSISALCFFPTFYYLKIARDCGNEDSKISVYFLSLQEVFNTAAQTPQVGPILSGVLFAACIGLTAWFCRKNPEFRSWGIYSALLLLSTPFYFGLCRLKNVVVAPRHYISLVPSFVWMTICARLSAQYGLYRALHWIGERASSSRSLLKLRPEWVMAIFLVFFTAKTWIRLENSVVRDWRLISEKNVFGRTRNPACARDIPYMPQDVEKLNELCRSNP